MAEALKGTSTVVNNMLKFARDLRKKAAAALYQEALIEMKESMRRTPVDTGELRASHHVSKPLYEGFDASVTIEVGGPAAPYALYVHENLEADHKVGQAKFLESTLNESRPFMAKRIAARLQAGGTDISGDGEGGDE